MRNPLDFVKAAFSDGVLKANSGGTGGKTAEEARANLEVARPTRGQATSTHTSSVAAGGEQTIGYPAGVDQTNCLFAFQSNSAMVLVALWSTGATFRNVSSATVSGSRTIYFNYLRT